MASLASFCQVLFYLYRTVAAYCFTAAGHVYIWPALIVTLIQEVAQNEEGVGSAYATIINVHNKKKCTVFGNCIEIVLSGKRCLTIPNSKFEPMALNASTPFSIL
uniref:Uncharacterized protein n=1 Tax=Glossina palpalis gambiensis TaxID=67801 RepID=A0A1B0AU37_9MUSC